jgi:hypothetical protein
MGTKSEGPNPEHTPLQQPTGAKTPAAASSVCGRHTHSPTTPIYHPPQGGEIARRSDTLERKPPPTVGPQPASPAAVQQQPGPEEQSTRHAQTVQNLYLLVRLSEEKRDERPPPPTLPLDRERPRF